MAGMILVGVDGSAAALRWAMQEADRHNAAFQVRLAWHYPYEALLARPCRLARALSGLAHPARDGSRGMSEPKVLFAGERAARQSCEGAVRPWFEGTRPGTLVAWRSTATVWKSCLETNACASSAMLTSAEWSSPRRPFRPPFP